MTSKKPTIQNISVNLLNTKGQSSLVEYVENDVRRRVYIPADLVKDGFVSSQELSRGIPYGYPWEEISFNVGGVHLAEQMQAQGLWTIEDVLKNPKKLRSALNAVVTAQLSEILTIAHREKKGVTNEPR